MTKRFSVRCSKSDEGQLLGIKSNLTNKRSKKKADELENPTAYCNNLIWQ